MSNRRLSSKEIDELLDKIVTEDFIKNALKEFDLYSDKEENKDYSQQDKEQNHKVN